MYSINVSYITYDMVTVFVSFKLNNDLFTDFKSISAIDFLILLIEEKKESL